MVELTTVVWMTITNNFKEKLNMKFSQLAWQQNESNYQAIIQQAFNQELMNGTLARDKFAYYIEQDSFYLQHFARVLAHIAARLDNSHDILQFLDFAKGAIVAEQQVVHEHFRQQMNLKVSGQISPASLGYTSYLHFCSHNQAVEVAIAAVLPCFWIYYQLGCHIQQSSAANNPYQPWVDNYAGEDFARGVSAAIEICDRYYAQASPAVQQQMLAAFATSTVILDI
jgi:thiaminase/transcriptional activator TenA